MIPILNSSKEDEYKNRGMVFVGANDGMLHAFTLGRLELFQEKDKKAKLHETDLFGNPLVLGKEAWAFIPQNALPYLKYVADTGYCHLYYVDLTPYVFDASTNETSGCTEGYWDCDKTVESWRTILIGGMRLGGACTDAASSYGVQTPAEGLGYSSYFALDITNPNDPQVLWEFSNANIPAAELATGGLGFSTTGPAIVRISAKGADGVIPDHRKNGRWFVIFGSGPTGPIDTNTRQFKGYSDQPMKLFIIDLKNGPTSGNLWVLNSGIQNAFAGSMVNGQIDFDQNDSTKDGFYQDEAVYFGYIKAEDSTPTATTNWNTGGVLRLLTKNSLNPDEWALSKVIENIGPVTAAVAKLQNYKTHEVRLFWGTGRYYFKMADDIDDAEQIRSLFGVKEPCYGVSGINNNCTTTVSISNLGDANSGYTSDPDGWYIDLDASSVVYKAERNVTDTLATPIGAVFFTTTKPTADICEFGGASHLWAVDYKTGGDVSTSKLRGKALLQVSTGSIEEIDLKTAFTERGKRRTVAIQGVPPAGAPPGILIPPDPINKIIHIRER
jgi:type IV pilus assembly protein PilY1